MTPLRTLLLRAALALLLLAPAWPATMDLIVKTDNVSAGSSDASSFMLPLGADYVGTYWQDVGTTYVASRNLAYTRTYTFAYDCTVDWGDGSQQRVTNLSFGFPNIIHTYARPGIYTVRIGGTCPTFRFNNTGDRLKLLAIAQWGDLAWESMNGAFYGCANLQIMAPDLPDTGQVEDFTGAFRACAAMRTFPTIDTSAAVVMQYTWADCSGLTSFPLLDTAHVQSFFETWVRCTGLSTFPALDTSQGRTFHSAWNGCSGLTGIFPALDFSKGTDFEWCWVGCSKITGFAALDLTEAVNLGGAWSGCSGLTSFPAVTCPAVRTFCTDVGAGAWNGCSGLTAFPAIGLGSVLNLNNAWNNCTGLTTFPALDLGTAVTANSAWNNCSGLTSFQTTALGAVTNFAGAWNSCSRLTSFPSADTHSGTNFSTAWQGCSGLNGSDFPTLDLRAMTNGTSCFNGVRLSDASYAALLNDLSASNPNTGVAFHGGSSTYPVAGIAARTSLVKSVPSGGKGWTITDGGIVATLPFTCTVNSGAGSQFTLPLDGTSTYDALVQWEANGLWEAITSNTPIVHSYPAASTTYTISIVENVPGGFPALRFNNGGSRTQLTAITKWGANTWASFNAAFYGCTALTITATDGATANTAGVADWNAAFRDCTGLNASSVSVTNLATLNKAGMTDGGNCFLGCTLPTSGYSDFLVSLDAQNAHTGVTFHGGVASKYSPAGKLARDNLTGPKTWTITDGGSAAIYWVSAITNNWSAANVWATTSGGVGSITNPNTTNYVCIFDGGGGRVGNCTLDAAKSVAAVVFTGGYTGTFAFGANNLTIAGGADLRSGGPITATTGGPVITASGILTPPATALPRLTINSGATTLAANPLTVTGALTIASGATLAANGQNITVAGNWANSGSFIHGGGTVTWNGTAQTISGNNTFNDLTILSPSAMNVVSLTSNTTQTILGTFTAIGTASNAITINAVTANTQARLSKASGTVSCSYLTLKDNAAIGGATWVAGVGSIQQSKVTGWIFPQLPGGLFLAGD